MPPTPADPDFENLLQFLKQTRGFDFTGYKRSSLMRLMTKRMQVVGVTSFADYLDFIEVHPDEFTPLFNTLLINVTAFYRDPAVWELLAREVIPRILEANGDHGPIRAWSVGCATGEEAYTIAILLAEAVGPDAFRKRVKIFATDVDEDALSQARSAVYAAKSLDGVSEELREKYFEPTRNGFQFRGDLRRSVIFGRNDLVQDAPISHVDLITCRNTLMYFTAEAQNRIVNRLHFALEDRGFLVLGRAETMFSRSQLFRPIDLKLRVFAKLARASLRERLVVLPNHNNHANGDAEERQLSLRDATFDRAPTAQFVVDAAGTLVMVNAKACESFGLSQRDVGRPLKDLQVSYRPVELRSLIDEATAQGRSLYLGNIEHSVRDGESAFYDLQVMPMTDAHGVVLGASVTFLDVTRPNRLQNELLRANQELETAYEELQSSNEELQSSNEELETTNEELQSTNEELETMNEELQSTNEELQTVNDELNQRTEEVDRSNAFLESILGNLRMCVIVLDQRLDVIMWNSVAEQMWGLRVDEVRGKSFPGLDIGLPVDSLRGAMKASLGGDDGLSEIVVDGLNRRGKAVRCRVRCAPLRGRSSVEGVIITVVEIDG